MHSLKKFVHIFLLQLGGINSLLAIEHSGHLPLIKDTPTMILGMDVSHGSPGRSDIPSTAAVRLFFFFISPIFVVSNQTQCYVILAIQPVLYFWSSLQLILVMLDLGCWISMLASNFEI
jgi:hypothetical protein